MRKTITKPSPEVIAESKARGERLLAQRKEEAKRVVVVRDNIPLESSEFRVSMDLLHTLNIPQPIKNNKLKSVLQAIANPEICGMEIAYDAFRGEVVYTTERFNPPITDGDADGFDLRSWVPFSDHHYTALQHAISDEALLGDWAVPNPSFEHVRQGVHYVARKRVMDTLEYWATSLRWDGKPRVANFLANYFGAEGNPEYLSAVSLYLWTALAGRAIDPGCKADSMPVACGDQGLGKSSAIAAIAPEPSFFTELSFHMDKAEKVRLMRGRVICEYAEMAGLRNRELETVKGFLSVRHDSQTAKYKEYSDTYPRRCVFFGSTNDPEILADPTGARRFYPFDAGKCDPEGIADDREQLWAEAVELWGVHGVMWRDAARLAPEAHKQYVVEDAWQGAVAAWLAREADDFEVIGESAPRGLNGDREDLTGSTILTEAVGIPLERLNHSSKVRLGTIMANLGYKSGKHYVKALKSEITCYRRKYEL